MSSRSPLEMDRHSDNESAVGKKRKRVVLSIQQKQEVLSRLADGEKPSLIAEEFGISRQQVSDIKKNENRILKYCTTSQHVSTLKRKTLKASTAPAVERELLQWFTQEHDEGRMVTNDVLQEKALELFGQSAMEGSEEPFKASTSWMRNFKRRHGIKRLSSGDGYDGLTLPDDLKMPQSPSAAPSDVLSLVRALTRRIDSLEQLMQQNYLHMESRMDDLYNLWQQHEKL